MPNKQLTVSVVMCTHNGMEFIQEQLESILSQTYPIYQLIISDDNSTDGTLEFAAAYVREFVAKHKKLANLRFQTIENIPALGVTKNFEGAIKAATGDLIALCDQDDTWVHEKIRLMVKEFENDQNLLLLHSDAELVDSSGNNLGLGLFETLSVTRWEYELAISGNEFPVLLRRNIVTGATALFRRTLVQIALPIPEEFLHDEWLALVASSEGQAKFIPETLIQYRQHNSNVVGVRKLGLKHAVGRILFPRTERNRVLLARTNALAEHSYFSRQASNQVKTAVQAKLTHEQIRSAYPRNNLARILPIASEVNSGRYKIVGLGFQDIIRDLIQPE